MNSNKKPLIITVVIIILVAILVVTGIGIWSQRRGELDVIFQLQDTTGVVLKLNGQTQPAQSLHSKYSIKPGDYILDIAKPGYKDFSTNFTLGNKESLTVNVTMSRSEGASSDIPLKAIADVDIPGSTVTESHYYYQKTWALVKLTAPTGNTAWVVYKYDDASSAWQAEAGPGTAFEADSITSLPADVVSYMTERNLINGGDVQ